MLADAAPNGAPRRPDPAAALRERIEILEEENRQLREALMPTITFPLGWQLQPQARCLLSAVRAAAPGYLTWARAGIAVYGFDEPDHAKRILQQTLCRARHRLREIGVEIEIRTVWSSGLLMPPGSVATFDRLTAREVVR